MLLTIAVLLCILWGLGLVTPSASMLRRSLAAARSRSAAFLAASLASSLLVSPMAAGAGELGLEVEPAVAIPLTRPQSQRFDAGGAAAVKLLYGLTPSLDVTAGLSLVALPRSGGSLSSRAGTAWGYGAGLQLKRPHDSLSFHGISPWVDADVLYVHTGPLGRLGFAAATGLAFPLGDARNVWVGPFVRYQQVLGRGHAGEDGRDARLLLAGVSFELGGSVHRRTATHDEAGPPPAMVAAAAPDRDRDGIPDGGDLCPDVAGPSSNSGCPVYEKVVVQPDRLELKDKIQFAWNSPAIEQISHPALDEVVRALQESRGFRVQLEGHASSEGGDEHNQTLSEGRAQAVLEYLASHGIARERLTSKGFSSSMPIDSNTTEVGREANRRVEFVVHFIIVNPGSAK
jgi:outer membrane protein OmpA-like peptidoglycan-associated protein